MNGSFGVLSSGLAVKRLTDITEQMETSLKGSLGASLNLLAQTPEGQLILRSAEQIADLWEFGEQAYNSFYPDTASGVSLQNARALTNNFKIPETASVVNGVVITGTPSTVVPANFKLSISGDPTAIFQIADATVIGGGGTVTASFVCLQVGPIPVAVDTLIDIVTAVPGIVSATNPDEGETGTDAETDAAFRIRSAQELNRPGTGTFSGLLASVQRVQNVSSAYEFVNDTNAVDANGLQPHSVQLVVVGGVDQDIANAIFAAKGTGIETNGTTTVNVMDSQGYAHAVKFSRLTETPIFMDVAITKNTDPALGPVYPGDGDTLVQTAILAFASAYRAGQTVITTGFFTPINSVPGVTGATILIGLTYPPVSSANIPIPIDEIAQFLQANVVVHS